MLRIIIVDDHAIVRKGIKQIILEEYPLANVSEAEDVESLLASLMKEEFDIIICDISLPGRSGLEALQQVKQIKSETPVLIMSMHSEDQYAIRVLKAGASGYLNKATIHSDLINAIQAVLNGRKFITPGIAEKLAESLKTGTKKQPHELLSNREIEVLLLLASGKSTTEIAKQLFLNSTTVSTYRARILEKMSMKSNAELIRYVIENKLV